MADALIKVNPKIDNRKGKGSWMDNDPKVFNGSERNRE
jgi:hypothetical protein